jgi:hypothetical protein
MPKSKLTVEKLKRRIRENDPELPESSESFKAALLILSAAELGHLDRARLANFTGIPTDLLGDFAERLLVSEIWMADGSIDLSWENDEDGIEFWMMVNVATGDLEREKKDGQYEYRMTDLAERRSLREAVRRLELAPEGDRYTACIVGPDGFELRREGSAAEMLEILKLAEQGG